MSLYSSPEAKQAIHQLYWEKMDELAIDYETREMETSLGNTHVIITGTEGKPPLFLIHGSNGCAPVAIEAMIDLLPHFRVYAPDVPAQPNLSSETRTSMKDLSYGQWVHELLAGLGLKEVTLMGISLGGLISWKTLLYDEARVKLAFLIVPAGIVNGNPLAAMGKVFIPMRMYMWKKKEKHVKKVLKALFTDDDPFALKYLSKIFLHFNMDFSPVPTIKKEDAARIQTPIHILAAEEDVMFPGEKLISRARSIFPSLKSATLLPGSKHVPAQSQNIRVLEVLKQFEGVKG
jgi:pimeloyl-ACP methyl ester carboxylesterase